MTLNAALAITQVTLEIVQYKNYIQKNIYLNKIYNFDFKHQNNRRTHMQRNTSIIIGLLSYGMYRGALRYIFTNVPPFLPAIHLHVAVFVRNFYSTVLPQEFDVQRTKRNTL